MASTMTYRGLEWKKCPFCGNLNHLEVESEKLFDRVKEDYGDSALEVICHDCGCQLWVYPREVEVNDYSSMIKLLNNKWNNRGRRKSE